MRPRKIIQTDVDPAVYSFILKTAESKGLTLKEAARQALSDWAAREGKLAWDPLFDLSKVFTAGRRTDASKVDEVRYVKRKPSNYSFDFGTWKSLASVGSLRALRLVGGASGLR